MSANLYYSRDIQEWIKRVYIGAFGHTPLNQRLQDVLGEAIELSRYTDIRNLREEAGDLLGSLIQLANECDWDIHDLVSENIQKIQSRKLQYKTLGRKINVAILGGALDPPTLGHIEVAKFVLDTSKTFDEVFLTPCYAHLYNKKMAPPRHRENMCRIAAKKDPRIKLFSYEIENEFRGETYHMAKKLLGEKWAKDKYSFSMVIGQDNANSFDKWANFDDLERIMRFVVVPRAGVAVDPKSSWYLKSPHIYLMGEKPLADTSSTEIRTILKGLKRLPVKMPKSLDRLLDPEVYDYIKQNNLYR